MQAADKIVDHLAIPFEQAQLPVVGILEFRHKQCGGSFIDLPENDAHLHIIAFASFRLNKSAALSNSRPNRVRIVLARLNAKQIIIGWWSSLAGYPQPFAIRVECHRSYFRRIENGRGAQGRGRCRPETGLQEGKAAQREGLSPILKYLTYLSVNFLSDNDRLPEDFLIYGGGQALEIGYFFAEKSHDARGDGVRAADRDGHG